MHQPTVVVRECADMYLAETLRSRLAIEGIQAIVTGTDPVLALAFGGAVTNRLLHLEVAEQDYLRAFGILEADERLRDTATAWVCSRCDEQNEPAFELCWSCNKKRDPGDTAGRSATEFNQEPQDNLASITDPDSGGSLPTTSRNPYAPPAGILEHRVSRSATNVNPEHAEMVKSSVRRIFYASTFGLLLLPPLLNLYSLYLTFGLSPIAYRIHSSRRRLAVASILNGMSVAFWTFYWLSVALGW